MEVDKKTCESKLLHRALRARAASTINGEFVPVRRPRDESEQARPETAQEFVVQTTIEEAHEQRHTLLRPALLARAKSVVNGKFVPARRPRQSDEVQMLNAEVYVGEMRLEEAGQKIEKLEEQIEEQENNARLEEIVMQLANEAVCSATLDLAREQRSPVEEPVKTKCETVPSEEPSTLTECTRDQSSSLSEPVETNCVTVPSKKPSILTECTRDQSSSLAEPVETKRHKPASVPLEEPSILIEFFFGFR